MSAVRTSGGLGNIAAISLRDGAAVLKAVESGAIRTAAGLKAFFGAMSVAASPAAVSGYQNSGSPATVTTNAATAVPDGGIPPYTYDWNQVGASDWTVDSPTSATTTFSKSIDPGSYEEAQFACTVTDDAGYDATSNEVTAGGSNLGGGL